MAGSDITISFDAERVAANVEKIMQRKIEAGLSSDIQYESAEIYRDLVEYLVPKKSGSLRDSAKIVRGAKHAQWGIRYDPTSKKGYHYANLQYHTPFENRTTPGTFDHWNQHLTTADRQGFNMAVKNLVVEAMKNG